MRDLLRIIIAALSIVMIFTIVGCGASDGDLPKAEDAEENNGENGGDEEVKKTSILFIGNSYTYYNEMPKTIFKTYLEAAGYEVEVDSITKGGYKLSQFADPRDEYGARVEATLTGEKTYDYVILQEQSIRPCSENAGDFYEATRNLVGRIRATGAEPILYATWGRKTGNETLDKYGWTNESMTWMLAAAYSAIGEELGVRVIHVGVAFHDVFTKYPNIEIYHTDKTHPSYDGSFIAALMLASGIFGIDPTEIGYKGAMPASRAAVLFESVKYALSDEWSIPDEYKTDTGK